MNVKKWLISDTEWFLCFVNESGLHFFMPRIYNFSFYTLQTDIKIAISNWLCLTKTDKHSDVNTGNYFIIIIIKTAILRVAAVYVNSISSGCAVYILHNHTGQSNS